MTDDTESDTQTDEQTANDLAGRLRDSETDDELTLRLDDSTELGVSIVRSLFLPSSVREDVAGGSLRHAVRTDEETAERLGLPSRGGLIAAEELERDAWNRPQISFYNLVRKTDDEGEEFDDYGDVGRTDEIAAVSGR